MRAFIGVFRAGKCLFRIFNDQAIEVHGGREELILEMMATMAEKALEGTLEPGDYVAWDYERGRG